MKSRYDDLCRWINLSGDAGARVTDQGSLVVTIHGQGARFNADGDMLALWGLGNCGPRLSKDKQLTEARRDFHKMMDEIQPFIKDKKQNRRKSTTGVWEPSYAAAK
jgi:hypothetical protein